MKRAAIERGRTVGIWRQHQHLVHRDRVTCICDLQVNRFRKGQRRLGCGRPRCYTCHGDKLMGIPTVSELRARDAQRIGIEELQ